MPFFSRFMVKPASFPFDLQLYQNFEIEMFVFTKKLLLKHIREPLIVKSTDKKCRFSGLSVEKVEGNMQDKKFLALCLPLLIPNRNLLFEVFYRLCFLLIFSKFQFRSWIQNLRRLCLPFVNTVKIQIHTPQIHSTFSQQIF